MKSDSPRLSVVMPVFNARRYLARAVDSILRQSFKDFEFIIVDDASTDGCWPMLQQYAKCDSRIRLLRNERNEGVVASANRGVESARAEWIARMDADDFAKPSRFEKQLGHLETKRDLVLLGSDVDLVDPFGNVLLRELSVPTEHEEIDNWLLTWRWPIINPTTMLSTEAVRKVGGYSKEFVSQSDHDLFLKLAEIGRVGNLSESLLCYRLHLDNMTFSGNYPGMLDKVVDAAIARRGIQPPGKIEQPWIAERVNLRQRQLEWALCDAVLFKRNAVSNVRRAVELLRQSKN